MTTLRSELPDLKKWWDGLSDVYSKVLQTVVERLFDNLKGLSALKKNGHGVGQLKEAATGVPQFHVQSVCLASSSTRRAVRLCCHSRNSRTYRFGFTAPSPTTPRSSRSRSRRNRRASGSPRSASKWTVNLLKPPENPEKCVGIDVGILKYAHDTDGTAVGSLDLTDKRERLEREQRKLSRKQHGSNNYEKQRRRVAECHANLRQKRRDFLHKLSAYYAREYDLVAVEDLNVKGMMESPANSRNTASAAWRTFLSLLEYKCEREGHTSWRLIREGRPRSVRHVASRRRSRCGSVNTPVPPAGLRRTGTRTRRGTFFLVAIREMWRGHSESTPVETALPVDTAVSAKRVLEAGSPTLKSASGVSRERVGEGSSLDGLGELGTRLELDHVLRRDLDLFSGLRVSSGPGRPL